MFIFLTIWVNDWSASLTAISLSSPVSPKIENISSIYSVIYLTFYVAGVNRDEFPSWENAMQSDTFLAFNNSQAIKLLKLSW